MADVITGSHYILFLFLVEQRLFMSVYDERGMKGKSSGAEDLTSTPGAVPRPCSVWHK